MFYISPQEREISVPFLSPSVFLHKICSDCVKHVLYALERGSTGKSLLILLQPHRVLLSVVTTSSSFTYVATTSSLLLMLLQRHSLILMRLQPHSIFLMFLQHHPLLHTYVATTSSSIPYVATVQPHIIYSFCCCTLVFRFFIEIFVFNYV